MCATKFDRRDELPALHNSSAVYNGGIHVKDTLYVTEQF